MKYLAKSKGVILGIAVIAVAGLLAKTDKGVVFLVSKMFSPHYDDVDYSYYYINVTKIVWDAEEGEFRSEGSWYWSGSGYAPYSFDHYNTASRGENGGFNSAGCHIIFGHTEDVNLTHAFDSNVDENNKDDELVDLGTY